MKLERAIPIGYFCSADAKQLFVFVRAGPTISSLGTLWLRRTCETEYQLCPVCEPGESVEQVIISGPDARYLHCRVAVRQEPVMSNDGILGVPMSDSAIVTYRIADGAIVAKVSEGDFLALRPHLAIVSIFSLFQGQRADGKIRCLVMFGPDGGFTESWMAEVDVFSKHFTLLAELPKSFW